MSSEPSFHSAMANAESYDCIHDGGSEIYKNLHQPSKAGREMILDLGVKSEIFPSDETPTPIRLIRNCEEVGLFQDLQNVNPFEETFRKATEDIRSGSSKLEISSLCAPNNNDDSLHTPHVVYPPIGEPSRKQTDDVPRDDLLVIQPDADTLCLSLDAEEPSKSVVQQEADTSQEMQSSDSDVADEEHKSQGTIQFLLRMPNGKMVQLSSLPVEHVDNPQTGLKDLPIIKVDSTALKDSMEEAKGTASSDLTTATHPNSVDADGICSSGSIIVNVGRESVVSLNQGSLIKDNCQRAVKSSPSRENNEQQSSKMSIAKLRLKQALMNNSCPAATPSTSSSATSASSFGSSATVMDSSPKFVSVRRPSSTSDEGSNRAPGNAYIEEKRRRNRAAAMRCREKRKTWVQELERRANDMLRTNGQLQYEVSLLRDEVAQLKTLLLAHRDCPVTQALVQGPSAVPVGQASSSNSKPVKSSNKVLRGEAHAQGLVIQTPSTSVKPVILLGDPPVKRKRLQPSSKSVASTGPNVTTSTVPQTFVISSVTNASSKSATLLNSNFVNVFPRVLVANPTSSCGTVSNSSQVITFSSVPTISSLPANHFGVAQRQPFILPKAVADSSSPSKHLKMRSGHILSTNVIKVNPNVVDRDSESYDSDVEIIDVDVNSDFS